MLRVAQVTPYPWEDEHDVNGHVAALSAELRARGHRVSIVAPSHSPDLVRESRKALREGGEPGELIAVGELLPTLSPRRAIPSLPVDVSRTIEELFDRGGFDVVHVHEPWAPSASSGALRHSRGLNVATFHAPIERVLSTQVARRFVDTFFGRIDARLATFQATADLVNRFFPGPYEVVRPGAEAVVHEESDGPPHIVFRAVEERAALRIFLRALRRLPEELDWRATVYAPGGVVPASATRVKLRDRVRIIEEDAIEGGDIIVAASSGIAPAPGVLLRAVAGGAVPVVSRIGIHEEVVADGEAGLVFEPGDVEVLAAQLERAIGDAELRRRLRAGATSRSWSEVANDVEAVYERLAARRHDTRGDTTIAKRLAGRPEIDVDLHMHTDHSFDCATPVVALLGAARDRGLGAIAVTDHNVVSGALDAANRAADFGVKVIVAEEVKTASQGEVIGLFIKEHIPRGMTLQETIAEIKRQGGLVYVPHPFDRLHSIPDYEHLLDVLEDIDIIEVFNPRVALAAFNDEAVRFATKYRVVAGAGSDSHVAKGLGSVRIRMRDFDGPDEFLESLREADIIGRPSALYYAGVQALKFLQTKATPAAGRRAARERAVRRATRNL